VKKSVVGAGTGLVFGEKKFEEVAAPVLALVVGFKLSNCF
jgi:hypothetical protein